jgi:hypothetical protein
MAEKEPNKESLRAQAAMLLSQVRAQSIDIQRALSMARGNPTLQAKLGAAAGELAGIASELSNALQSSTFPLHPRDLMALESVVHSGEAGALESEAAAQGGSGQTMATAAQIAEVKASSADTRQEVESLGRDLFDRHIFDRYLHFSSPGDEAEFRKRQAADQKYVADQLARHTPEGNLNAGGGMIDSMLDLHAHGAGDSPEFMPRWNALVAKTERQRAAMRAAGQSTEEYDRNLNTSVRRFLKDEKHMTDAEIDKRLSGGVDPLEVVKPLLKHDGQSRALERQSRIAGHEEKAASIPLVRIEAAAPAAMPDAPRALNINAIATKLKAAGARLNDAVEAAPAHGLTVAKPAGVLAIGAGG